MSTIPFDPNNAPPGYEAVEGMGCPDCALVMKPLCATAQCQAFNRPDACEAGFIKKTSDDQHRDAGKECSVSTPRLMNEWEQGVLMALSVLNATHDEPSMCADVLNELGIDEIDCRQLDDFDKTNLRLIVEASGNELKLYGLEE